MTKKHIHFCRVQFMLADLMRILRTQDTKLVAAGFALKWNVASLLKTAVLPSHRLHLSIGFKFCTNCNLQTFNTNRFGETRQRQIQLTATSVNWVSWAALKDLPYTLHCFISDAWATLSLPLADTTFFFSNCLHQVQTVVAPFGSVYETRIAHLSLNWSSQNG
jgi:hypothetical protein